MNNKSLTDKQTNQRTQKTALLIDDDPIMQELHRALLHELGFTVQIAGTAGRGFELACKNNFDLIMSDVGLPDQMGDELIKPIRALAQYKKIPIIIVTAHGDQILAKKCLAKGATAFFNKPLSLEQLKDVLDKWQ
jgi:CheY-like chemotaxis protein